ncbi:MAG: carboxypeptidase regulatory-like domain-containing protein [Desulfobacterales bacterium]|nr:carboxypeptidase regulatory-like domain-containing protein [Desulfobacterales bacterium]
MKTASTTVTLTAIVLLMFTWMPPASAADGMVAGTVALEMEDGHVEPGNWIRILLVTRTVEVPKLDTAVQPGDPGYIDAVNVLHSGFYIQVQNRLAEEGYLFASTLTTDTGTFKIPAVAPGDYFVLVKFPGNIRGYKVAWQIPVKVASGKTTTVNLNRSNLALPTARR